MTNKELDDAWHEKANKKVRIWPIGIASLITIFLIGLFVLLQPNHTLQPKSRELIEAEEYAYHWGLPIQKTTTKDPQGKVYKVYLVGDEIFIETTPQPKVLK